MVPAPARVVDQVPWQAFASLPRSPACPLARRTRRPLSSSQKSSKKCWPSQLSLRCFGNLHIAEKGDCHDDNRNSGPGLRHHHRHDTGNGLWVWSPPAGFSLLTSFACCVSLPLTLLNHQTRIAPIIAHRDRRHSYFLPPQNRLRKRWGCSGSNSTLPAK